MSRLLLAGGTVVPVAPGRPAVLRADLLVEDGLVRAVGPDLVVGDAERVDVSGCLVVPGFVDAHRHTWQTGIRGVAADWSLLEYVRGIRMGYAQAYRPDDVHVALEAGLAEALDAGVTTVCDFCHVMNSPAHADAAMDAFAASGIRGLMCYGFYDVPLPRPAFRDHAARIADAQRALARAARAGSGRMGFGVALTETGLATPAQGRAEIEFARAHGLRITAHMGTLSTPDAVARLDAAGLLGPDMLHVHCNFSTDAELERIRDTGGSVCVTPETELQMGMGFPVTGRLLALGMRPSIGVDIVSAFAGDLFVQMRTALQVERALRNQPVLERRLVPPTVSPGVADALAFATRDGARALGLDAVCGSLEPGKAADVVVVSTDGTNFIPPAAPVPSIVLQARAGDVRHVIVGGEFRKRDGRLVGVDVGRLRERMAASNAYLVASAVAAGAAATPTGRAYEAAIDGIVDRRP